MNRRDFLRTTATGVAGSVALRYGTKAAAKDPPIPIRTIDTHIHLYDPGRPQGVPWPHKEETVLYKPHLPADFHKIAEENGIFGAIIIEASPWLEDNQWILDLVKGDRMFLAFIGNLELGKPEFSANLQRFAANPLFRGLRIGGQAIADGLGRKEWEADFQRLAEGNLTVDLLGNATMLPNILQLVKIAPTLRMVIDHLPFVEWDHDLDAAKKALADFASTPNVFAKVSYVMHPADGKSGTDVEHVELYGKRMDLLREIFGPDRVIYGSNWPVSNLIAPYGIIHSVVANYFSGKGMEAAEKYFWRNAHAAYRWADQ